MRRVRAYIGLGANLGDPEATLVAAVHALRALPGTRLRGVSRLYATAPVGVLDQPEFRNAVVALDVPAGRDLAEGALALLVALKALERALGRRPSPRWGPRAVDLDLLLFGRARLEVDRPPAGRSFDHGRADGSRTAERAGAVLRVPHPAAHERGFVLAPLADLSPGLVPPGWAETVATARERRRRIEGNRAVRPIAAWDAAAGRWIPIAG